jgi:hypothetical protein
VNPSQPTGPASVRRFDDSEGNAAIVEFTADSLEDFPSRLEEAGLDIFAFGSPTLYGSGVPLASGGWVWPLTSDGETFPFTGAPPQH